MPSRTRAATVLAVALLAGAVALVPVRADQIHRHGFSNKQTALVRGDTNLQVEEVEHDISTQSFKSQPSSEHIKLVSGPATGDAAYIHYHYDTPPAPVTDLLSAGVWVKATRPGVQFRARVVFPKETDPAHPDEPLSALVVGDTYEKTRTWQKLTLGDVPGLLGRTLPVLRAKVGRDVNASDAYVDRLVLNLYCGPGPVDVWVDDLDVGPVRPKPPDDPAAPPGRSPGTPTATPRVNTAPVPPAASAHKVRQEGGKLFVDDKPFFFKAIRHSGTPLFALRQAGFNTVWFPPEATAEQIDDAAREGFMVIPTLPVNRRPDGDDPVAFRRDADAIAPVLKRFGRTDAVLFWHLGNGYRAEEAEQVKRSADLLQQVPIARRPAGGDVWDGFQYHSHSLDVIGAHRWPLFTSLELTQYRDWLAQRRTLSSTSRSAFWTWVQTHLPDWYVSMIAGRPDAGSFDAPIGPQPEQIRLLTYLAVAVGCRGVGFWSDRFLASATHNGRDRLLGLALLNAELDMLAPVINAVRADQPPEWVETTNPDVKAAVLRGERGVLVLPIWLGKGSQYVTAQAASPTVGLTVKLVPEGAEPWLVSPSGLQCLRTSAKRVPGGTELVINDFDLVTPVVFTSDLAPNGLVVWWQDYNRRYNKLAAQWAMDLAAEQYAKVTAVHGKLAEMGVEVRDADTFLKAAQRFYRDSQKDFAAELYDKAHQNATRSLRPLRLLMRDHWNKAVGSLDTPTASPYAVSFYTLPQHWQMAAQVRGSRPGANALRGGDFELAGPIPETGAAVTAVPGWDARGGTLDRVVMAAAVVPSHDLEDPPQSRKSPPAVKNQFSPRHPITPADEGYTPPAPQLGRGCLKLEVRPRVERRPDGKPLENVPVLERTFLAVDGPSARFIPGTLVRVSAWLKVPDPVGGGADGVLFYDDAGGEPLGVRTTRTGGWARFHLYRRVPASGQIGVTVAMTGTGVAYVDDVRIEPLLAAGGPAIEAPAASGLTGRPGEPSRTSFGPPAGDGTR